MAEDLFKDEAAVAEAARQRLLTGDIDDRVVADFAALTKNYERLLKQTQRLVRHADRMQAELNRTSKSLDEKNRMLEGLSVKLSKYLSPQIYESIFSGRSEVKLQTQRKKLTVFFSDIKDFTATTDNMEPEDLAALLNHYLTEMSNIALQHGATIDKFIGDAIVIFFGDPESRGVKEDAAACVRMAMAMQRRMHQLQQEWTAQGYRRPFHMRIGINTGYCNVGNFGSEDRMDYTIIGGEVNLAARLEGICQPDNVTMSAETYALVSDFVHARQGEPLYVKGIGREIQPFHLVGLHDELADDARFVVKSANGLRLFLDLDVLTGEARETAVADLKAALVRLGVEPPAAVRTNTSKTSKTSKRTKAAASRRASTGKARRKSA
jgi:class 3 adenylate cyclase